MNLSFMQKRENQLMKLQDIKYRFKTSAGYSKGADKKIENLDKQIATIEQELESLYKEARAE